MKSFVVAVALLVGCGVPVELPGQAAAVALVWHDRYGVSVDEAPLIVWRWDRCPSAPNGAAAVLLPQADGTVRCLSGLYTRGVEIDVAWRGAIADSALAHELMHARQWRDGVDDPDHLVAADWVEAADAASALRAAGL